MDWMQVGAFVVSVLGLGLAGVVYITRQFNRSFDRIDARFGRIESRMTRIEEKMGDLEQAQVRTEERLGRVEERIDHVDEGLTEVRGEVKTLNENVQNLEKEQARMLGFLEGRGVMGKAPREREVAP